MFNVCPHCGLYSEEKAIRPAGPHAICLHCGHRHRFLRLPLFILTGASGTGKSAVCLQLASQQTDLIPLESDILWRAEFATPEDGYRSYRNLWLRVAKNISQAGRPVLLCGTALPEQFESCPERRYFSAIHYLALVCDGDELARRLEARPSWRNCGSDEFLTRMLGFNRWLQENAGCTDPPMTLMDTTRISLAESTAWVEGVIRDRDA